MNEFESLELLAKHYYCPHPATLISDRIVVQDDLFTFSRKKVRKLDFECENCGAKWSTLFDVDE